MLVWIFIIKIRIDNKFKTIYGYIIKNFKMHMVKNAIKLKMMWLR
jgi:hypothetical protein